MKVRDSGMPDAELWNRFFNVDKILSELEINQHINKLVEIGSGYGTFTLPASKKISGDIYAFDIEADMISHLNHHLETLNIKNISTECRDVLVDTTGLEDNSVDYMMLFNILHYEKPEKFFDEAYRILKPNGKIGIIHWRCDIETPRGPDISIRPKPEDILDHVNYNMFEVYKAPFILEPYHYGLIISKFI